MRVVELDYIPNEAPEDVCIANTLHTRLGYVDGIVAVIRHPQVMQQQAAVGMGIRTHPACPAWCELGELRLQPPLVIKELSRPIALQPFIQELQMLGVGARIGQGHLVRMECAFDPNAINDLGGPVHPFGDRNTIIGQRGRLESPSLRAPR